MISQILAAVQAIERRLTPPRTLMVDIGVVAGGAGYAAELLCNRGPVLRVKSVWFSRPSVQVTLRLIVAEAASTGGTLTNGIAVPMRGSRTLSTDNRVRLFTAAPTAGTAIGDIFEAVVPTDGNIEILFGENGEEPLELSGSEALGINVSGAATIVGRITFQEIG